MFAYRNFAYQIFLSNCINDNRMPMSCTAISIVCAQTD